jgi:glyoxylate carboligase
MNTSISVTVACCWAGVKFRIASIKMDVPVDTSLGEVEFDVDTFGLYMSYRCSSRTRASAAMDGSHFEVSSK